MSLSAIPTYDDDVEVVNYEKESEEYKKMEAKEVVERPVVPNPASFNKEASRNGKITGRTLVCPVDGSVPSHYSLDWVLTNLVRSDDTVMIVHCRLDAILGHIPAKDKVVVMQNYGITTESAKKMQDRSDEETRILLQSYEKLLVEKNINYCIRDMIGETKKMLAKFFNENKNNISLVCCGSTGHGAIARVVLGSVSDFIIRQCLPLHIPTILIPSPPMETSADL